MKIRAKSFRAWFKHNLSEYAEDIARHGADAGYPHITYTTDTVKIFDRFGDEIWEMAAQAHLTSNPKWARVTFDAD